MFPFRFINYLLDRVFVVLGAFCGSQIPTFIQQYMQRLTGRVDELQLIMKNLQQLAFMSHKNLDAYIEKFLTNSDPDFMQQGLFMQSIVTRTQHLNETLLKLQNVVLWKRPFVFLESLQMDIAESTFNNFQPGLSLTLESACYAVIGLFLGLTFYQMIYQIIKYLLQGIKNCFNPLMVKSQKKNSLT